MGCGLVAEHSTLTCEVLGLVPGTVSCVGGWRLRVEGLVYRGVFPIEMSHNSITCIKNTATFYGF